jgi:hypothetical protein
MEKNSFPWLSKKVRKIYFFKSNQLYSLSCRIVTSASLKLRQICPPQQRSLAQKLKGRTRLLRRNFVARSVALQKTYVSQEKMSAVDKKPAVVSGFACCI